jgi:RimJ/RimL family protein N-acetyltransferase
MRPWEAPFAPGAGRRAALEAALPRIETERLLLRMPRIEDWAVLGPCWFGSDDGEKRRNDEESWLDFNQLVASWLLRGYGPLTITAKVDGAVLGLLALNLEYGDAEPEVGWLLAPGARGRGYATEAARAVKPWLDGLFGAGGYVSYVAPGNATSNAVAERLGGRRDPVAEAALAGSLWVWRHGGSP